MRTVPAAITAARQAASSRLCKIWRIERTDGVVLRFTEHDRDLTIGGETFEATASFDPSTIKTSADLSVDDLDVQGAFDNSRLSARDLLAGRYNGASFWVGECLWDNTAAGKDILRFGWIGRVKEIGGRFVAELLGPTMVLQRPILRTYSAACPWTLGDAHCKVDLGPYTQSGVVTAVADHRQFQASGLTVPAGDADYFMFGKVTFGGTGVENDGLSMEVKSCNGVDVALFLPMPFEISVGDTFTISAGCNKTLGACINKFANKDNFGGFPHVPVSDDVIKGIVNTETEAADGGVTAPAADDGSWSS